MALTSTETLQLFSLPGSLTKKSLGAVIASAASITPTLPVHHISGTSEITTIVAPGSDYCGFLVLIADAAFTFNTGGNIGYALTAVAGQAVPLIYDPVAAMWYPCMMD